jgi:hypothetical protein
MVKRKPKDNGHAVWQCKKCGAWVFTRPNLHWPLCAIYQKDPDLVAGTILYYEKIVSEKVEIPTITRKKRKKS